MGFKPYGRKNYDRVSIDNGTYFDHEGDGFAEQTAWIDSDDGILVYDRNGNGIIGYGHNLLKDEFTEEGIKKAFQEAGITVPPDEIIQYLLDTENGLYANEYYIKLQQSGLTQEKINEYSSELTKVLNDLCTKYNYSLDETEARVLFDYDAEEAWGHVATKLDAAKAGLSNTYINTDAGVALTSLAYNAQSLIGENLVNALKEDNLVAAWYEIAFFSNSDGQHTNRRYREADKFLDIDNIKAEKIKNLAEFLMSDQERASGSSINVRDRILSYTSSYFSSVDFPIDVTNGVITITLADATLVIKSATETEFTGNEEANALYGSDYQDTIIGEAGNDTLTGGAGKDEINGGADDDTIYGSTRPTGKWEYESTSVDDLTGGEGDDYLEGGGGNDIYRYNLGDGSDTIYDRRLLRDSNGCGGWVLKNKNGGSADKIIFGEGISLEDLIFSALI